MRVIGSFGEPRSRRNGWSQTLGDYVEELYHGTAAYAQGVYSVLRGNCSECELEVDGMSGIVRARFASTTEPGGEELLRVEVRLGRNDVQKDIFEPGMDGYSIGISDTELRRLKATIENPESAAAYDEWQDNASAEGLALYKLAIAGVRYRIIHQPVIVQITTASAAYVWPANDWDTGLIFSQASMLATLRVAPLFVIPGAPAAAPTGFNYGWKLARPTYEQSSDGHSSEALEFEFGLWPTQIYGSPV